MAIIAKQQAFQSPPDGSHPAVICDVYDMGIVEGFNGQKQHKVRIYYMVNLTTKEGYPMVVSQSYTLSLHNKSALYKLLEALGVDCSAGSFDVEKLVGTDCIVVTKQEGEWCNVKAVSASFAGAPKVQIPADYVSRSEREKHASLAAKPRLVNPQSSKYEIVARPPVNENDDIPF